MSERQPACVMVVLGSPEDMKTMTPQRAMLLAHETASRFSYRAAMTIVVPQILIAFMMLVWGVGVHGVLCGVLAAGFLNAALRLVTWWAAKSSALS